MKPQRIPLLAILIMGVSCASVQEVGRSTSRNEFLPELKIFDLLATGGTRKDQDDFKLRDSRTGAIRMVLHPPLWSEEIPLPAQKIAFERILQSIRSQGVTLLDPPEDLAQKILTPDQESWPFLEKSRADAVLDISFQKVKDSSSAGVNLRLIDPFYGETMGEMHLSAEIVEKSGDEGHRIDFYGDRNSLHFLREQSTPLLKFSNYEEKHFKEMVHRSVSGTLSVLTSYPDADIYLMTAAGKKSLGRPPLLGIRLDEGRYTVDVERKGRDDIHKEVQIRAGREKSLMITWADDPGRTSAVVYSVPEGLRLSMDGVVEGTTPVYFATIQPGDFAMEFSRPDKKGSYTVMENQSFHVENDLHNERIVFLNYQEDFTTDFMEKGYWNPAAEDGTLRVKAGEKGLGLQADTKKPDAKSGILSLPFAMKSFVMDLEVYEGEGNHLYFGILSSPDSVFVKMQTRNFEPLYFKDKEAQKPIVAYEPIDPEHKKVIHAIRIEYDASDRKVRIRVDGDTVLKQVWNGGDTGRIAILTDSGSSDGRPLIKSFRMVSGDNL